MNGLKDVFDSLYSRFVLRDFFAKIVPGSIFGLVIIIVFFDLPITSSVLSFWYGLFFIGIAWILGIFLQTLGHWLHIIRFDRDSRKKIERGIIFQKIEPMFRLIKSFFKKLVPYLIISNSVEGSENQWQYDVINQMRLFRKNNAKANDSPGEHEHQQFERLVVLKESSGNSCIAFTISGIFFVIGYCSDWCREMPNIERIFDTDLMILIVAIVCFIIALVQYKGYRHFDKRQWDYLDIVLKEHEIEKYTPSNNH